MLTYLIGGDIRTSYNGYMRNIQYHRYPKYLLKIDDIEEEHEDEITTQQSKMLDDILSFLEQCEKHDQNKNSPWTYYDKSTE